jgi:hypothetical protein
MADFEQDGVTVNRCDRRRGAFGYLHSHGFEFSAKLENT